MGQNRYFTMAMTNTNKLIWVLQVSNNNLNLALILKVALILTFKFMLDGTEWIFYYGYDQKI